MIRALIIAISLFVVAPVAAQPFTFSGAAPTSACQFNTTLPTLGSGTARLPQCDTNGVLLSDVNRIGGSALALGQTTMSASLPVAIASNQSNIPFNATQWGGTNLGAPSNYGTSPGAVNVPGVNAFITNSPSIAPLTVTNSALVKGTTSAMTGTSSTQIIAAVTSQHIYVTNISCNNSSSTATLVTIQDGSGGTTLGTVIAPAGGGDESHGYDPLFWTTAGNGLYAADVTTGASVICTASGHSSAN